MIYFLSAHDDDNALFGAYVCQRIQPTVVVVLDSYIQPNRGELNCSAEERAEETRKACEILRCKVLRLGLRDDTATEDEIEARLRELPEPSEVYAPMLQGGNIHHDMVHRAAMKVFGKKVTQYPTYTKTELWTKGDIEITPSTEEKNIKRHALECYQSQLKINGPHFLAVVDKPEFLC